MKHHVSTVLITVALALVLFGCTTETTPTAISTPHPTATQMPTFAPTVVPAEQTAERLSRFGVYEGYSDHPSLIELPIIPPAGGHQLQPSVVGAQTADGVTDWGPPVAVSALILVALVYGRAARRSFVQRENKRQIITFPGVRPDRHFEPSQQHSSLPSWHTLGARRIDRASSLAKLEMTTTATGPAILTVAGPAHALVVVHRKAWHRALFARSDWDSEFGVTRVGNDGAGHRNSALDADWNIDPASGFSLN
jgi:hypothetical protein